MRSYFQAALILGGSVFALYPAVATFGIFLVSVMALLAFNRYQSRPVPQKVKVVSKPAVSNIIHIKKF